ncbi:MAG: isoprenylcysteine carboxylmethyltransferase family protein [Nitrospirota bacterium]
MTTKRSQHYVLAGTIAAYLLITFEILIMISPFAVYFYSVYAPLLGLLASSPLTAWTTEFFLPHMVFTNDPVIAGILYLQILFIAGLALFLLTALPLYYVKLVKRGVLKGWMYSYIRHPQYLFLAISGFGLLIYWPRFIVLILYITMLFVYYLLARHEESRMRHRFGVSYEEYMARTPMFLPGEPGGKVFRALFGWISPRWAGILAAYAAALVLSVALAWGVRTYAVAQVPKVAIDRETVIPVFPRPQAEVRGLYEKVIADARVREFLAKERRVNLAYLIPGDYFLNALVTEEKRRFSDEFIRSFPDILEWQKTHPPGGLGRFFRLFFRFFGLIGAEAEEWRIEVERFIFVKVTDGSGDPVGRDALLAVGVKREPELLVDVDADTREIIAVVVTSGYNEWGATPMPTF